MLGWIGSVPTPVWLFFGLAGWFLFNLRANQNKLLYHPVVPGMPFRTPQENPAPFDSPRSHELQHKDVYISTDDGVKLHAWFVPAEGMPTRDACTLVFFHANAMNMGFRLPNVALLAKDVGVNVFIFDYRGYGNSEGEPTEEGLRKDAGAVMHHLAQRTDINQSRLILFGRSLGGAVALHAASAYPSAPAALILENTFTSVSGKLTVK
jgi:abhydrolase domain-containing protein 13